MIRKLVSFALVAGLATPALAQTPNFHWEKVLPAGQQVSIHNVNGDVKVTPSTTGRVEVVGITRGRGSAVDHIKAEVVPTSKGIVVCVLYDDQDSRCDDAGMHSHGRHDWSDAQMDLEVAVPTNLTVAANSVSGDVSVSGAQGNVMAKSVSGNVHLDHLRVSAVTAYSVSGDVDVRVEAFTGSGDLSVKTVSGDVTLALPRQFDADVSMTSVSGSMNTDYALTLDNGRMSRRHINARIGNGGRRLELSTVSGDVKLGMAKE